MILQDAIDRYVAWRQAHGAVFDTSARVLHSFSKHVGGNIDCSSVASADVLGFLAGNDQLTRYRANKYSALTGFYRYAISRGYAARSLLPAPEDEPRTPRSAPPYVYSRDQLRRLFGAIDSSRQRPVQFDADTLRALLLVLYGAGLRFGEAQRLTLVDADLAEAVLTIRNTLDEMIANYRASSANGMPALAAAPADKVTRLRELATLRDDGVVPEDEYAKLKAEVIGS